MPVSNGVAEVVSAPEQTDMFSMLVAQMQAKLVDSDTASGLPDLLDLGVKAQDELIPVLELNPELRLELDRVPNPVPNPVLDSVPELNFQPENKRIIDQTTVLSPKQDNDDLLRESSERDSDQQDFPLQPVILPLLTLPVELPNLPDEPILGASNQVSQAGGLSSIVLNAPTTAPAKQINPIEQAIQDNTAEVEDSLIETQRNAKTAVFHPNAAVAQEINKNEEAVAQLPVNDAQESNYKPLVETTEKQVMPANTPESAAALPQVMASLLNANSDGQGKSDKKNTVEPAISTELPQKQDSLVTYKQLMQSEQPEQANASNKATPVQIEKPMGQETQIIAWDLQQSVEPLGSYPSKMTLQVHQKDLGDIRANIEVMDKQSAITFVTETSEAKRLLQERAPELREMFTNSDLQLTHTHIEQQLGQHQEKRQQAAPYFTDMQSETAQPVVKKLVKEESKQSVLDTYA